VEIMEKVPFIGNKEGEPSERGRVRLLGKLEMLTASDQKISTSL